MFEIFNEDWLAEAACGGVSNPDMFHPFPTESANPARKVCATCDVRLDCLNWALKNEFSAVWGGLTAAERNTIVRARRTGEFITAASLNIVYDTLPTRQHSDDKADMIVTRKPKTRRLVVPAIISNPAPKVRAPRTPAPAVQASPVDTLTDLLLATESHADPTVRALRRVITQAALTLKGARDAAATDCSSVA